MLHARFLGDIKSDYVFIAAGMAKSGESLRRRWTVLLPVIFISYSLSYLDRANFSFGAAAGMASDLHISAAQKLAAGFAVLCRLFPFPDSGRGLCPEIQRQAADLFGLIGWACSPAPPA